MAALFGKDGSGGTSGINTQGFEDLIQTFVSAKLIDLDYIWTDIMTSADAYSADFQQNYETRRAYSFRNDGANLSGDPSQASLFGSTGSLGTAGGRTAIQNFSNIVSNIGMNAQSSVVDFRIPISAQIGNFTMTEQDYFLETHGAYAGRHITDRLEKIAQDIARFQCADWWSSNFGTIENTAGWNSVEGTTGRIQVAFQFEEASEWRLTQGLIVQATTKSTMANALSVPSSLTGGTALASGFAGSPIYLMIDAVDLAGRTVIASLVTHDGGSSSDYITNFADIDGVSNTAGLVSALDSTIVTKPNVQISSGVQERIFGINDYYKDSGDLLGNRAVGSVGKGTLNVEAFPEVRSSIFDKGGAPLTRAMLRRHVTHYLRSQGIRGHSMDYIATTPGVLDQYLTNLDTEVQQVRYQNDMISAESTGYSSEMSFYHDKEYKITTSNWISEGELYFYNKDGWQLSVPPTGDPFGLDDGPLSNGLPNIPIHFFAEQFGLPSPAVPLFDTSTGSNIMQNASYFPFRLHYNVVPSLDSLPVGLKLTNLAEDKVTEDMLTSST